VREVVDETGAAHEVLRMGPEHLGGEDAVRRRAEAQRAVEVEVVVVVERHRNVQLLSMAMLDESPEVLLGPPEHAGRGERFREDARTGAWPSDEQIRAVGREHSLRLGVSRRR